MTAEQGTMEWRQQRTGLITGSRVAAILGRSPFSSRRRVMKEMLAEARGEYVTVNAPPLQWGRDNEPVIREMYEALYANEPVQEVGLVVHPEIDFLGASPDGLVGPDGLVEIKAPYGLRNDPSPEFKSILDMPHYMDQIQLQLACTRRDWCDFIQWAPADYEIERVAFDPDWLPSVIESLALFMDEFREGCRAQESEGVAEDKADWDRWSAAYVQACADVEEAEQRKRQAKDELVMMLGDLDEREDDVIQVQRITSTGRVDYKKVAKELAGDDADRLEQAESNHRGNPSMSVRVNLKKEKKA